MFLGYAPKLGLRGKGRELYIIPYNILHFFLHSHFPSVKQRQRKKNKGETQRERENSLLAIENTWAIQGGSDNILL